MEDIIEEIVGREIMDESDKTTDMRELARVKKKKMNRPGRSTYFYISESLSIKRY